MMKKTIQFVPIIAIAMAGTMSSCVDSGKDLYDPSYETPNPMGDGFAAPDDIDWNMITTKNVSVEVKDEEGGLFAYIFVRQTLEAECLLVHGMYLKIKNL